LEFSYRRHGCSLLLSYAARKSFVFPRQLTPWRKIPKRKRDVEWCFPYMVERSTFYALYCRSGNSGSEGHNVFFLFFLAAMAPILPFLPRAKNTITPNYLRSRSNSTAFGSQLARQQLIRRLDPLAQQRPGLPGIDDLLDPETLGRPEG
jgi:hypothetical protein